MSHICNPAVLVEVGESQPQHRKFKLSLQLIRNIMKQLCSLLAKTTKTYQRSICRFSTKKVQYLDYQATTPVDYRVLDAMMPYFTEHYGNPHSKTHQFGWDSATAIEQARRQVADLIGADEKEIIFTSGATESNNMVLKGLSKFYGDKRKHIITTQIEHKCILDTCRYLELEGFKVTYLPVEKTGLLNVDLLRKTIEDSKEPVLCVSVIFVHNQIGVIQNIQQIGKLCKEKGIFFHTDGAQAVGKIELDVNKLNIDLMSISGHKIYGPKGIGALYLRRKPRVRLAPLINGGGQERGLRSGTLPTPLVVGMGKACQVAKKQMHNDARHIQRLYNKILNRIQEKMTHVELNGCSKQRYFGNVNMSFAFVEGESLLMALKNYAISSGSACTSQSLEPSYVLRALGVSEDLAHTSLRIGIGRFTSEEEVDEFLQALERSVLRLRELSPLWQMVNEGMDLKEINWAQPH